MSLVVIMPSSIVFAPEAEVLYVVRDKKPSVVSYGLFSFRHFAAVDVTVTALIVASFVAELWVGASSCSSVDTDTPPEGSTPVAFAHT